MVTTQYYTARAHLNELFAREGRQWAFRAETIPAFQEWKRALRAKLRELTGICAWSAASDPQLLERCRCEGYTREKMVIQTEPEVWMPCFVLIPDTPGEGKRVPVIAAHGHAGGGKAAVAGDTETAGVKQAIARFNYDYGVQLAREGYLSLPGRARLRRAARDPPAGR